MMNDGYFHRINLSLWRSLYKSATSLETRAQNIDIKSPWCKIYVFIMFLLFLKCNLILQFLFIQFLKFVEQNFVSNLLSILFIFISFEVKQYGQQYKLISDFL